MVSRTSTLLLRAPSRSERNTKLPSPRVPTEIIDQILDFVLAPSSDSSKLYQFTSIASFTLVSAKFRQIALRRYFRELDLISNAQWTGLYDFLEAQEQNLPGRRRGGGFAWVKSLSASSKILSFKPIRLGSFSHLQTLSIDLVQEGLSTQHPLLSRLFGYLDSSNMTSLTLSNLPRLDVLLLRVIANTFPRLVDLYLSCTERIDFGCCWACFEDSLGCTIHSPIPDDYSDVEDMSDAFASALKPLGHLTHLHLGVFLSDDQLLYSHIAHSIGDGENMGMVKNVVPCQACFDKAVDSVRLRELAASIVLGQRLKMLKTIGWSSFFHGEAGRARAGQPQNSDDTVEDTHHEYRNGDDLEDADSNEDDASDGGVPGNATDNDMKTTIWILRSNGRIRVRRAPW
ncbi:hypothetical protein FPV67DRAFT_592605 [Lyophyllum atratum]|nr:hypothetical protein FPV67DRAFT_592605 [Lyophyllum atratum]